MEQEPSQNTILIGRPNEIIITETGSLLRNLSSQEQIEQDIPSFIAESSIIRSQKQQDEINNLSSLLKKRNLHEELFTFLRTNGITVDGLLHMKERHLDELFVGKCLNTKIIFEYKLSFWQNECGIYNLKPKFEADAETVSSPIESWINSISSPSTSTRSCDDISIMDILNKTEQGKSLLKSYNENGSLIPADRTNLVHKIIQHYIENDIFLSVSKIRNLSEQIIRIFPTENQNTYFIGRGKNPTKGKLWDRYQGRKPSLKKLTSFSKSVQPISLEKRITTLIEEENSSISDLLYEEELKEISDTLKHIRKWDDVIPKWKQTVRYRRKMLDADTEKTLQKILLDWPLYKYAQAPQLIDIDYDFIYPGKNLSYIQWEKFCRVAVTIFEERIKDSVARNSLKQLKFEKDNLNTDNINILYAKLLHAILVPSSKVINGKRIKHTISDSQAAFTLPVSQSNEIDGIMLEKRKECLKLKTTLQPLIIIVGSEHNYTDFYVSIDEIKFKFNTYLEALEYCFKAFFVLNLKYPKECALVWIFIQKFLFSIDKSEGDFPVVATIIADLKGRML